MNDLLFKKILNALPREPGVMNSSSYPRSAVLASLFEKEGELHIIFQKRSPHIRQGGEICFPGGRFDKKMDQTMEDTVRRETMEEMGIDSDKISIWGQTDTLVASMGAVIHCFLGELKISDLSELSPNEDEVEKVFSVPLNWFIETPPEEYEVLMEVKPKYIDESGNEVVLLPVEELGLPERYLKPWGRGSHKVYVYRHSGETIWGITAQLVKHIAGLFRKSH